MWIIVDKNFILAEGPFEDRLEAIKRKEEFLEAMRAKHNNIDPMGLEIVMLVEPGTSEVGEEEKK